MSQIVITDDSNQANEAFNTAKLTAYWLSLAKVPEAVALTETLNIREQLNPDEIFAYEILEKVNPVIHEVRYSAINRYVESTGIRNILDNTCHSNILGPSIDDIVLLLN